MAEQKCPKCNARHGFEIVPLIGCEGLEAVQCKSCGAPLTILNSQLLRTLEVLVQRVDSMSEKLEKYEIQR